MRCTRHGRSCGEPPTVVQNPQDNARYVITELIGKGGFARVYTVVYVPDDHPTPAPAAARRGEHGSLAPQQTTATSEYKRFAMKVISKCRLGDTAAGRETLRNEVSIHRQLQHPAIVRLVAFWEDQYRIYLLMNLVDGHQLEQYVHARGRLTEQEASLYASNILEALSYLHANRIVHRDLKLANLLLTQDRSRVLLCDFGLATHLDSLRNSDSPSVCGTPNYVAPELLTSSVISRATPKRHGHTSYHKSGGGKNNTVTKSIGYTTSADIWSMGVVLYSMLVGSGPFDSDDLSRTFRRIRTARFTFPIGLKLSPNAKSLIRSLLAEDHSKRPTADQALQHPFFSAHDIPKLILTAPADHVVNGENGTTEAKFHRESTRSDRDQRSDRVDERQIDGKVRRLGTNNRRSVDVRQWSGVPQQQAPRQHSTSGIAEDGTGSMRGERRSSVREDRDRDHYNNRTLQRAARERSSSLCTPEVLERATSHHRRSSLNNRTLNGLRESKRSGVSAAGRRFSFNGTDQRTEVLNLSVTLSAALLRGRKYLDEQKSSKSGSVRKMSLDIVARRVSADEKHPPLVRRWLDYTSKYGFATMMEDGRTSCCFNDGSIMFFVSESSDVPDFAYVPPRTGQSGADEGDATTEKQYASDISKKACLCTLFADMMVDGGRGSMYDLPSACNVSFLKPDSEPSKVMNKTSPAQEHKDKIHVREWARFRNFRAAAFRLSNHSIHVKFDVGEDKCDDFLFTPSEGMLFYRAAKAGAAWRCSVRNLGEFSAQSEYVHKQLELCSQAISRFLE